MAPVGVHDLKRDHGYILAQLPNPTRWTACLVENHLICFRPDISHQPDAAKGVMSSQIEYAALSPAIVSQCNPYS